jgi:hypothetical protein
MLPSVKKTKTSIEMLFYHLGKIIFVVNIYFLFMIIDHSTWYRVSVFVCVCVVSIVRAYLCRYTVCSV